jgi:hypothetical protein
MERHRGQQIYPHVIGEKHNIDVIGFGRSRNDLPYSITEYQARISNFRNQMKEKNIDILLVRKPEDFRYLTNFQTIGDCDNQSSLIKFLKNVCR